MRYFKNVKNGYILFIGQGMGGDEISESEYEQIMSVIQNKPQRGHDYDFRLKTDLTWEQYSVEPLPEPEPTLEEKAEAYDILMGEGND